MSLKSSSNNLSCLSIRVVGLTAIQAMKENNLREGSDCKSKFDIMTMILIIRPR